LMDLIQPHLKLRLLQAAEAEVQEPYRTISVRPSIILQCFPIMKYTVHLIQSWQNFYYHYSLNISTSPACPAGIGKKTSSHFLGERGKQGVPTEGTSAPCDQRERWNFTPSINNQKETVR
jgi:hypothetical protein